MPLYKFYKICPKDIEKTECYIGHTIQPLRKRFTAHWNKRNRVGSGACSSSVLMNTYGREGLEIVLIHELELPGLEEARREERRLYEEHRDRVVNKYKPYMTDEEFRARGKIYRDLHKDKIRARHKIYSDSHRDEINAWQKEYRDSHKDKISARGKIYRLKKKEQKSLTVVVE